MNRMKKWIIMFVLMITMNNAYSQIVVICTGEYAKVYHSKDNCTGLNNCKGEIIKVFQSDAVNKYKLQRPCCVCWYPSPIGCATDDMPIKNQPTKFNPYVPAFSSDEEMQLYAYASAKRKAEEAAAYAATGALVFGAIANSNDFYIHYIKASDEKNYQFNENISSNGLAFGFRVVKNKSAFEYGASFIQDNIVTIFQSYNYYSSSSESKLKWGAHLNYLYNIPVLKNSNKLNLYLGASLNSFFSKDEPIGIGGIGGVNFNILNWLKIDARYEKTSTTNRIGSGIILNFNNN
jgi:hypothetical protein